MKLKIQQWRVTTVTEKPRKKHLKKQKPATQQNGDEAVIPENQLATNSYNYVSNVVLASLNQLTIQKSVISPEPNSKQPSLELENTEQSRMSNIEQLSSNSVKQAGKELGKTKNRKFSTRRLCLLISAAVVTALILVGVSAGIIFTTKSNAKITTVTTTTSTTTMTTSTSTTTTATSTATTSTSTTTSTTSTTSSSTTSTSTTTSTTSTSTTSTTSATLTTSTSSSSSSSSTATTTTTTETTTAYNCTAARPTIVYTGSTNTSWIQVAYNYTASKASLSLMFGFDASSSGILLLDDVSIVSTANTSVELLSNPSFNDAMPNPIKWTVSCANTCSSSTGGLVLNSGCRSNRCYKGQCRSNVEYIAQTFSSMVGQVYTVSFWYQHVRTTPGLGGTVTLYAAMI